MPSSALRLCTSRALALGLLGGLAAGPAPAQEPPSAYEQLQTFSAVLNSIRFNYADSITYAELVHAAIDGMLHSLDPHSYFVSRADWERRSAFERGELAGSGIALEDEDSTTTVLDVLAKSPAAKAGVQPGDRIAAVNDTSVAGLKAGEVALRLAGPKGEKVRLGLQRGPRLEPETLTVTVKLDFLKPPPVVVTGMADSVTGYVRLTWFGPKAGDEMHDALRRLTRQGARQVILDLRNNPGGVVDAAVEIASQFFVKGTLVFRTRGRKKDASEDYVTKRDGEFPDLPLVVLINERSASASEALAASLQDHDRALILGRRSFGKGLVQTGFIVPPAGDMVELTIARVFTPSGRVIQRRYRGIGYQQYWSFAGKTGAAEDTTAVFHTDRGRPVRGGGGIEPDVWLPAPAALPAWWSVAADSGFDGAIADSVALTLGSASAQRTAWVADPAPWQAALVAPFLARVRRRLGVAARADTALEHRLGRIMAARVVEVRWGPDAYEQFLISNDPDIRAATGAFSRLPALLSAPR